MHQLPRLAKGNAVTAVDSNKDGYEIRASYFLREPVFFHRLIGVDPEQYVVSKNGVFYIATRRPEYDWWFGGEYWQLDQKGIGDYVEPDKEAP